MPKFARGYRVVCLLSMLMLPLRLSAADYSARFETLDARREGDDLMLRGTVDFRLSPKAREAIAKGVPLSWVLQIKLQRDNGLWYRTLHERRVPFVIRYEALLNQYSVNKTGTANAEMFATLNTALGHMAAIRESIWPGRRLTLGENDRLALKIQFDREFLPIPLRPESYFDPQWDMSSDWLIWHPQK